MLGTVKDNIKNKTITATYFNKSGLPLNVLLYCVVFLKYDQVQKNKEINKQNKTKQETQSNR